MALQDITTAAVRAALDEFSQIGRDAFLEKYKVGAARGYYVVDGGAERDAKAVLSAAHGKLPKRSPLSPKDFHGGEATVSVLERLGFKVTRPRDTVVFRLPYEPHAIYHRQRDIHQRFGGQERGGISTPEGIPFVFLFTGESGERFGYADGWQDDGSFDYTGEGQRGPMEFVRGNRAIRDHVENGKDLLLFEAQKRKGLYRFTGSFGCSGYEIRPGQDADGAGRDIIVFKLVPVDHGDEAEIVDAPPPVGVSLEDLRRRALEAAKNGGRKSKGSVRTYYERSVDVRNYVLARAEGVCEGCKKPAPFTRTDGSPYLEPHHVRRIADGGPDHPRWVAAICPNCHREIHHGARGKVLNEQLIGQLAITESDH